MENLFQNTCDNYTITLGLDLDSYRSFLDLINSEASSYVDTFYEDSLHSEFSMYKDAHYSDELYSKYHEDSRTTTTSRNTPIMEEEHELLQFAKNARETVENLISVNNKFCPHFNMLLYNNDIKEISFMLKISVNNNIDAAMFKNTENIELLKENLKSELYFLHSMLNECVDAGMRVCHVQSNYDDDDNIAYMTESLSYKSINEFIDEIMLHVSKLSDTIL